MDNQSTSQILKTSQPKFVSILRIGVFSILFVICFYSCGDRTFTIGIVGDQFGSDDAKKSFRIMHKTVQKLCLHNPDVLLHVGDIVESIRGVDSFKDYKFNFNTATTIMNSSGKPWLLAIGDHDVVPPVYQACSPDRSREEWFLSCANQFKTPIGDEPYYSKDIRGYHFISLYSMENLHTDPRWGSIFLNKINTEQLTWLRNNLENNKHSKGIIVLVHQPHWYVWSNWKKIHDLLREYPVIAVIAGHFHYDQDDGMIDGIRYLVMGASGGAVKDTDAHSGGVQEYAVLKLIGNKIKNINLFEVNSDSALELTPRRSMDRIQAISCMLDNLWQDINLIRVGDSIVNTKNDLNALGLTSLSNPIDLPIEITIDYPDSILILGPTDSNSFTLKPGERVGWANYSNVGQWYQVSPLWQAKLSGKYKDINSISLSIVVKFNDIRKRYIRRTIEYTVK